MLTEVASGPSSISFSHAAIVVICRMTAGDLILGGGKRIIWIMDVKGLAILAVLRGLSFRTWNLIPSRIYAGHEVSWNSWFRILGDSWGPYENEWGLFRALSPSVNRRSRSLLSRRVRRVRCFPANVLTFCADVNAQTRTILARLRRASCSTGSGRSVLRLAKQWKSLSALRRASGKSTRVCRQRECRGEAPYQCDVSRPS